VIERSLPGIEHLQNPHPLFVHYPLAFLLGAAIAYLAAWIWRSDRLAGIAWALLLAGTAAGAVAIGTGLYAEKGVMVDRSVRAALLEQHEMLMIATGCLAVALSIWAIAARPFPRRLRVVFVIGLLAMVGVMMKGADNGGRMVYDYNAGGSACGQPIEFTK
jgi:uncharacterized membrane protein